MRSCEVEEGAAWDRLPGKGGLALSSIKLTIERGLRLHFYLDVDYRGRYLPPNLNNKEQLMLHLIKGLKWRVKFFDGEEAGNYLYKDSIELEADVDGDQAEKLSTALKALMKIEGLRRNELERLRALPLEEACKELAAMLVFK
jgi:hypothetical protein